MAPKRTGGKKRRSSKRRAVSKPAKRRLPRPKDYWLWLYYPAGRGSAVEAALLPWQQWGPTTGSGSDFHVSDISWEHPTLAVAYQKMKKMHSILAKRRVPHLIQIVDTSADDSTVVAKVGRYPGKR